MKELIQYRYMPYRYIPIAMYWMRRAQDYEIARLRGVLGMT